MEQADEAMMKVKQLHKAIGALGKAFYKKYGKEALPIIAEVASRSGEGAGKAMRETVPVKDMKAFGEHFRMTNSMPGIDMEIVELSDKVLHWKVSSCSLGFEGTSRELCEANMNQDRKKISVFLGKDVDMKIIKTVAAGDRECEVIFSVK